jgi:hypothetical protein
MASVKDEDPSFEDMDRFSHTTGFCPECGAEIWDEAFACPECDAVVEGEVGREPPHAARLGRRTAMVLVAVVLLALLGLLLRLF